MVYLFVLLLLLILFFHYDIIGKSKYKKQWLYIVFLLFVLIAGLRYRLGVDTTRYLYHFYHDTPNLSQLTWEDLYLGKDPLFWLINSIVFSLGGRFYVVQLLHALFVNFLLFKYLKKHSEHIYTCLLLYCVYMFTAINMEEMRASMSLVVCLFANDYILDRKWVKGFSLYIIGCFFHASAVVMLIMPLFFFLRFNMFVCIALLSAFVLGYIILPFLQDYLFIMEFNDTISEKATKHFTGDDIEKQLNLFGYLGQLLVYIYALIPLYMMKHRKNNESLLKLEPLLMIFLLFAMISMNIGLIYRFTRFYVIYYILFASEFIANLFGYNSTKLDKSLALVRSIVVTIPLFFFIAKERFEEGTWERYHPYSSVIERSVNVEREKVFSNLGGFKTSYDEY